MQEFKYFLDECGFKDFGGKLTCCNEHREGYTVWERLDKAVAMIDWISIFPSTNVVHLGV